MATSPAGVLALAAERAPSPYSPPSGRGGGGSEAAATALALEAEELRKVEGSLRSELELARKELESARKEAKMQREMRAQLDGDLQLANQGKVAQGGGRMGGGEGHIHFLTFTLLKWSPRTHAPLKKHPPPRRRRH